MQYEDFAKSLAFALSGAGLRCAGSGMDTLDPRTLDRVRTLYVEPLGGQTLAEPFHVTGAVKFAWDALLTARFSTTEEDFLTEVMGRDEADTLDDTERPWIRVDITLRASLPYGEALALPSPGALRNWAKEAAGRLEAVEPLLAPEIAREGPNGRFEVLGWKGEPRVSAFVDARGETRFDGVSLSAWQSIQLPRVWDDPDRAEEEPVDAQLDRLAERLRAALHAWSEVTDHLRRGS